MFLQYYGLREQPFSMTPDPRYLYMGTSHREALASLIYGIETGRGFVSLIAEPGMGKTTLLFQLLERFRNSARTVFLFQTQGGTREFLSNLISDLGLVPNDRDLSSLQRQLNEILIQEARSGRQFVLVIDEAQNLEDSVLESVRMLSNFETSRSKLMQIVLAGQPALSDKLARPELEQLMQRVSIICRLNSFTRKEVSEYIDHRLRTAGYKGGRLFTPEALSIIADVSGGIPRNINNICFHALSLAYAKGQRKIDVAIIQEILRDLDLDTPKKARADLRGGFREAPMPVSGLEGVTLNGYPWDHGERVLFRNNRYSPPAAPGIAGGGWPRRQAPRWPFWAVTFLMLVLTGEFFWAYLPAVVRHEEVTQLIASTVGKAKEIATKYKLLTPVAPPESQKPETTAIHSDAQANDIPEPLRADAVEPPAAGRTGAEEPDSPSAGGVKAKESSGGVTDSPAATDSVLMPVKAATRDNESSSANDSALPDQIPRGTVVVESNIGGGVITINGETNAGWRTPHMFDLPEGMYRISVSQQGYSTWFRVVRVTAGHKHWVTADLHLPHGVVVIETEPPGMQVFIDGKAYGPSEVEAALDAGLHSFKVVPPGGRRPFEGSFVLKPGGVLTRKIRWLPEAGQPTADNNPATQKLKTNGNSLKEREQS